MGVQTSLQIRAQMASVTQGLAAVGEAVKLLGTENAATYARKPATGFCLKDGACFYTIILNKLPLRVKRK